MKILLAGKLIDIPAKPPKKKKRHKFRPHARQAVRFKPVYGDWLNELAAAERRGEIQ